VVAVSKPFFVDCRGQRADGEPLYIVAFRYATNKVLDHDPIVREEADFLCAHMNAAYWRGHDDGKKAKLSEVQEVLGIRK
jgi:hypothetical protein